MNQKVKTICLFLGKNWFKIMILIILICFLWRLGDILGDIKITIWHRGWIESSGGLKPIGR